MCLRDDKMQHKLRATLNLIHTMSRALTSSTLLEGDLAHDATFYCSEMILRAAIELHNDVSAAISDTKPDAPPNDDDV